MEFGGLKLIIAAIKDFPTPKNITDDRSWFGVVNQLAWAYSNADVMQPFRDLVSPSTKFFFDDTL